MKEKRFVTLLLIALMLAVFPAAGLSYGETEPLTLSVEKDPDCLLSEAGEMTYLRFTLQNNSASDYTLYNAALSGELLSKSEALDSVLEIKGRGVLEFRLNNLSIPENAFDRDITFTLTWQELYYDSADLNHLTPLYKERSVKAVIVIERFVEPVMTLIFATDHELARSGETVTVTYTLKNETKFDMTNITLWDNGVSTGYIPIEKRSLLAGETMTATFTFTMGTVDVKLNPYAEYTVRGQEATATCATDATITAMVVDLQLTVQQYPATEEGTLFALTISNAGTHTMTAITVSDEIGTLLNDPFDLAPAQSKSITFTVPSAVAADGSRLVSFSITALDNAGKEYTLKSQSSYEVFPYVATDQVNLQLIVTVTKTTRSADGSLVLTVLFELRNYSEVPISNAVITENSIFNGVIATYDTLGNGVTTFSKDFTVTGAAQQLSFILTAYDPAMTQYATVPMTLDISSLTSTDQQGSASASGSQTIDTAGTIYDTELYSSLFKKILLILCIVIGLLLIIAMLLRQAELSVRKTLPPSQDRQPFKKKTGNTGPVPVNTADTARMQFGYMQPAKLRYMDRTDQIPVVNQYPGEAPKAPESGSSGKTPVPSKIRDITASFKRPAADTAMITEEKTIPFKPVSLKNSAVFIEEKEESRAPRSLCFKETPKTLPQKKQEILFWGRE